MDPDISTPHIHTIQAAPVSSSNGHVVRLTISASSHDEMEHRGINKNDIVHGEVRRLLNAKQTSTVTLAVLVILIPIAFAELA